jgi:hypothetical protein
MAREFSPEELGIAPVREFSPQELGVSSSVQQQKPEDVGIVSGTGEAFKRGLESFGDIYSGYSLAKSKLFGEDQAAAQKMQQAKVEAAKPQEKPALTFADLERIYADKGIGSALSQVPKYITEQVAQSAPQMAVPLAVGAGAGAISGPFAPVVAPVAGVLTYGAQQLGNLMTRQAQEKSTPQELDVGKAATAAAIQAPIGYFVDRFTVGMGGLGQRGVIEVGKELAARKAIGEIGAAGVAKGVAGQATKGAAQGFIAEAPTEVLEQSLERWQAGLSLTNQDAINEYKEAFAGAGVSGGAIGAGSRGYTAYSTAQEKVEPPKVEETKTDIKATPATLLLPSPEEIVINQREYDPLKNPLGNFNADELTPEQIKYIDADRKDNGKPRLSSYSLEDLVDAVNHSSDTPEAKQGAIDTLLTFKSGYTGEEVLTPQDIFNMAEMKNIETQTVGFNDFLRRTTGTDALDTMSEPQLYSAFNALSKLDTSPELQILPEGTNAVRYSEKQYANALKGLEGVYDEFGTNALSRTSVIQEIQDFGGLERAADAEALYKQALRNNDLEENLRQVKTTEGIKTVPEVSLAGKTTALPSGFDIKEQEFKQGVMPESYEIRNGSVLIDTAKTEADANQILEKQTKINEDLVKQPLQKLTQLEKNIEARNRSVDVQKAKGFADTLGFQKMAAYVDALNKIDRQSMVVHQNDIKNFTNPLNIVPVGEKPVTAKKQVFYEDGKPLASFGDKYQAEQYGIMKLDDAILQQIVETAPTTKGILPKRYAAFAAKEIERRAGKAPKGIEVKRSIYSEKVNKDFEKLQKSLLPALKRFGLDSVALRIVDSIADGKADGSYVKELIKIAYNAQNPMGTLRHESIHALKELGAFTAQEWKVLSNKAKSEWIDTYIKKPNLYKSYQDAYKADNGNLDGFDAYIIEEAIAEAFSDFSNTKPPAGLIGNIFYRLNKLFESLGNTFKRLGYTTAADVFSKVEAGETKPTKKAVSEVEKRSFRRQEGGEKVIFEVAPDPNNLELNERWNALDNKKKLTISDQIGKDIVNKALEAFKAKGNVVNQIGSYENDTNPSFALHLDSGNPLEIAKFLGHALSQDGMMVISPNFFKGMKSTGAITINIGDKSYDEISDIYQTLRKISLNGQTPVSGQSTIEGKMVILNDSSTSTAELAKEIDKALDNTYDIKVGEIYTAFPSKEEYDYANTANDGRGQTKLIRERSRALRAEATQSLETEIEKFSFRKYTPEGLAEPDVRPSSGINEGIVLGVKQENASTFEGIHYGKVKTDVLSGSKYGTGIKGAEAKRLANSDDQRIKNRVYFYIAKEDTGKFPSPEAGLGTNVYTQTFDNILAPGTEMSRLNKEANGDANTYESSIVDAGYDGYAIPNMGMMVILNHDVPVHPIGTQAEMKVKGEKFQIKAPKTEEFKQWFEGSKVVNEDGSPKLVFTGTSKDTIFNSFRISKNGVWFSEDPQSASQYAVENDSMGYKDEGYSRGWERKLTPTNTASRVIPAFLRIKKPFKMTQEIFDEYLQTGEGQSYKRAQGNYFERLRAQGYDGVDMGDGVWVAILSPDQIKSAFNEKPISSKNKFQIRAPQEFEVEDTGRKDNLIFLLQDKQIDLKRIIDGLKAQGKEIADKWNAYLQEELFHGRSATRVKFFIDRELQPLLRQMDESNITLNEMDDYLLARHAKEANEYIRSVNKDPSANAGMTDAEADAYIKSIPPMRRQVFDRLATEVDKMTKETRQLMVDYGLETQATIDAWEKTYKTYVPLFREETEGSPISTGRGYSIRGSTTKKRTGSSKRVVDVLANVAMQRERTIARGEKNRVGNSLLGLILQNPNSDYWIAVNPDDVSQADLRSELIAMGLNPDVAENLSNKPKERKLNPETGLYEYKTNPMWMQQPNVFMTRVNGQDRIMVFNENNERAARMAVIFNNLDQNQKGQAIAMMGTAGQYFQDAINVVGKGTRYFAAINTQYNPAFSIYNFMRDVGGAVLNLQSTALKGKEYEVISNAFVALKSVYQDLRLERAGQNANSKWAEIFEEFELEGGKTGFRDLFNDSETRARALEAELNSFTQGAARQKAKAVFDWLSDFNEAVENSIRVSAYKSAKDMGMSNAQSASLAKNLTVNFNRTGAMSKSFTTIYAFFNASIQGSARIAQTLMNSDGTLSSAGKMIIKGGITVGIVQAVLMALAGFEDDEPPDFVKDKNFVIPYGDKKYIAIPMPLGFNIIPSFGRRVAEFAMSNDKNVGKTVFDMGNMILDGFNPLGSATFAQTLSPTLTDPIIALAENKDFSGKPISRDDINSLNPTPGYTRAKDNASALSTGLAYAVNLLSGGTDFKKGVISPTPDQLDYLIGQITGGVGREVLKVEKAIGATISGEDLATFNIPIVGRMVGDVKQKTVETSRFYDNIKSMNEHQQEIDGRLKEGEDIEAYLDKYPEAGLYKYADKVYNKITKLKQERKKLKESGATDNDLKGYDEAILAVMMGFNEAVIESK